MEHFPNIFAHNYFMFSAIWIQIYLKNNLQTRISLYILLRIRHQIISQWIFIIPNMHSLVFMSISFHLYVDNTTKASENATENPNRIKQNTKHRIPCWRFINYVIADAGCRCWERKLFSFLRKIFLREEKFSRW